jgi:hypothetical protein
MIARCCGTRRTNYPMYGGRGIKVCERWQNSFEAFLADMGERPSPKHTIERKDNNGDYTPSNCRWATICEQARNRRNNRLGTLNGKTQSIAAWAEERGANLQRVYSRLSRGWTLEQAIGA